MTSTNHINNLIHNILNVNDFPLVPHLQNPDKELKCSFDFFINLNKDIILKNLMMKKNHTGFESALNILSHYKGQLSWFDNKLSFDDYTKLKPFLDNQSILKYREIFYKEYTKRILNEEYSEIDTELVKFIYHKDLELFISIAKKTNIPNAVNMIFQKDPEKVFDWINGHNNMYEQLIQLNQPQFILNNMNGKLDINDSSLRYFFENIPLNINILKDVKKVLGLETVWKYTHTQIKAEFYANLVETLDDLVFVINQTNLTIESIEKILANIKTKFPHIYENFNSLMFVKNNLLNK